MPAQRSMCLLHQDTKLAIKNTGGDIADLWLKALTISSFPGFALATKPVMTAPPQFHPLSPALEKHTAVLLS